MSAQKITAEEMLLSLTAGDEDAIEHQMGVDPYADGERKPLRVMRALVFVQKMREGMSPKDAKQFARDLPMREIQAQFADDEGEDGTEDLPLTPSGEGSAPSE